MHRLISILISLMALSLCLSCAETGTNQKQECSVSAMAASDQPESSAVTIRTVDPSPEQPQESAIKPTAAREADIKPVEGKVAEVKSSDRKAVDAVGQLEAKQAEAAKAEPQVVKAASEKTPPQAAQLIETKPASAAQPAAVDAAKASSTATQASTPTEPASGAAPAQPAAASQPNVAAKTASTEPQKQEPAVPTEPALYYVKMSTSKGEIIIELNHEKAPISVKNFLSYVDKKYYDGTIFHRVIPGFMIQGGGFTPEMTQKETEAPIKNEWRNGLKNVRGALAMARTSVPDSATSQFFVNVNDNGFLDMPNGGAAYAVFGRVISGMEVADAIVAVPRGQKGMHGDVPNTPIVINSVARMTSEDAAKYLSQPTAAPAKK